MSILFVLGCFLLLLSAYGVYRKLCGQGRVAKSQINQWREQKAKAKVVPTAAAPTPLPDVPRQKTNVCTCNALPPSTSAESHSFSRCTLNSEYCLTKDDFIVNVAQSLSLTENVEMLVRVCEGLSQKVIAARYANPSIPSMVFRANLRLDIQVKVLRNYERQIEQMNLGL